MNGLHALDRAIRRQAWLDRLAEPLHRFVDRAFHALGDRQRRTQDALHGTWLGHPLHPALTDATIGLFTAASLLDLAEATGSRRAGRGADIALASGLLSAVPTVLAGLTDWQYTNGTTRRVGMAHALFNAAANVCYALSLILRIAGARAAARALSYAGFAVLNVGGYLGGSLVFDHRVGVSRAQPIPEQDDFAPVAHLDQLGEGQPYGAELNGLRVVLVRQGDLVHALPAVCPHLGGPLDEGKVEERTIVCPWHGSRFELADGSLIDGPSVYSLCPFEVRVHDGRVEVRPRRQR